MPFPIPFLGPMGPLGTPIVPVGSTPPPFGSIGPNTPMPLFGNPLNPTGATQLVGGPFGGNVSYGAGIATAGGNVVIISNFGFNSVSNFGRLKKSGETFNDLRKELGSPNCVINKKNGVAVWVDETYRHTLNDTDDANGITAPAAGAGVGARTKGVVTTTVTLKPNVNNGRFLGPGTTANDRVVSVTADTAAHALAYLVDVFVAGTSLQQAWANDFDANKTLLDGVAANNFV